MENRFIDNIRIDRNNCFDALRYIFAISLIIVHVTTAADEEQFWAITGGLRVKAFFVITGFLVTYSLIRRKELKSYIVKRVARILPAYVCCILFCIIAGVFLTSLDTCDYLTSAQTWKYGIANTLMLNWIEPCLPGVFCDNPLPEVNGSLWSMKFEVLFYAVVPIYIYVCRKLPRGVITAVTAGAIYLIYPHAEYHLQLFLYFFSAILVLFNKDIIERYFKYVFTASLLHLVAIYCIESTEWIFEYVVAPLEVFTFAIVLIGIAYHCKPLFFLARYDNISYGLYLYHMPVAQILISLGLGKQSFGILLFSTFAITCIIATLSWIFIEKPILKRQR